MGFLFEKDGCPRHWLQILAAMLLMIFGTIVLSILFAEIIIVILNIESVERLEAYPFITPVLTILSYGVISKLLVTMFTRANRTKAEAMGLKFDSTSIRKMILGFLMAGLCVLVYAIPAFMSGKVIMNIGHIDPFIILYIIAEVFTIIGNELLFRGFILRVLMIRFPIYNAIISLLAIVGMYTFSISYDGIIPAIHLLVHTLLLAVMTYKSGSLVMPTSFHIMFNLLTRYLLGINANENAVWFSGIKDSWLFGNSTNGIEGSVLLVILYLTLSFIFVFYYKKVDNESIEFLRIKHKYENANRKENKKKR